MSEQTIACRCCVCSEDIVGRIELGDKRIRDDDRKVIAVPFKSFNGLDGSWAHCHCKAVVLARRFPRYVRAFEEG